jgi:hypothetical protein
MRIADSWQQVMVALVLQILAGALLLGLFVFLNWVHFKKPWPVSTALYTMGAVVFLGIAWEFIRSCESRPEITWSHLGGYLVGCARDGTFFKYTLIGSLVALLILGFREGLSREPDAIHPR